MAKFKNRDEAKAALPDLKEAHKVARIEYKKFCKEHKLEPEADSSGNEKVGKKWSKLSEAVKKAREAQEACEKFIAENKPAKEKKERASKYEYPAGLDANGKKKFRAAQRAEAKRAEKGDKPAKEKKSDKKKEEAPKEDKKSKKEKKAKEAEED